MTPKICDTQTHVTLFKFFTLSSHRLLFTGVITPNILKSKFSGNSSSVCGDPLIGSSEPLRSLIGSPSEFLYSLIDLYALIGTLGPLCDLIGSLSNERMPFR